MLREELVLAGMAMTCRVVFVFILVLVVAAPPCLASYVRGSPSLCEIRRNRHEETQEHELVGQYIALLVLVTSPHMRKAKPNLTPTM